MANISKRNRRREKEVLDAAKNRRELIAAQLSRRDLMKMGLLTGTGMLIPKLGLSARAYAAQFGGGGGSGQPASPPTTPWMEEMPLPPVAQPVAQTALTGPPPQITPSKVIKPPINRAFIKKYYAPQAGARRDTTTAWGWPAAGNKIHRHHLQSPSAHPQKG